MLSPERLARACALTAAHGTAEGLAGELVRRDWLTPYQAAELLAGRGPALALGSYLLLERLGAGGMGEVFRARHRVLGRDDAVKRILAERLDSPEAVARFAREARAAASLRHPNVVQVFDAGEAGGCHYLAMEFLAGEDLANRLKRIGPLPVADAVEFVRQACLGVQHAHEKGLVHRDVKPANLMLCDGRVVKVMDFGLALVAGDTKMTRSGAAFGTADYVAPEQVVDSHDVDGRADVYSLGCTLYHLLTGRTPFDESLPAARPMMHVSREPTPVESRRAEIPPRLAAAVRKMMAKAPGDRFATPGEAAAALGATSKSVGEVRTEPLRTSAPVPPKSGRRRLGLVAAVAVAWTLAMGCVGIVFWPGNPKPTPKESEAASAESFVNGVGMRFVRIQAGKFVMGSPPGEKDRVEDEGPLHEVEITRDFWFGAHEVTQRQYRAVMGNNPSHFCKHGLGADMVRRLDTDEFPVENVSWQDAQDFLKRLNERESGSRRRFGYRLPSEAEWEYSSRASGTYTTFSFGNSLTSAVANFDDKGKRPGRTSKAGAYGPDSRGLFDMHGNVWEWCEDWYDKDYYANSPRRDPTGPTRGSHRVGRGGSWQYDARYCRCAFRSRSTPGNRDSNTGFRVVAVPSAPKQ